MARLSFDNRPLRQVIGVAKECSHRSEKTKTKRQPCRAKWVYVRVVLS